MPYQYDAVERSVAAISPAIELVPESRAGGPRWDIFWGGRAVSFEGTGRVNYLRGCCAGLARDQTQQAAIAPVPPSAVLPAPAARRPSGRHTAGVVGARRQVRRLVAGLHARDSC